MLTLLRIVGFLVGICSRSDTGDAAIVNDICVMQMLALSTDKWYTVCTTEFFGAWCKSTPIVQPMNATCCAEQVEFLRRRLQSG